MKRIVALSLVFAVMGTAAVSAFAQTDNGQSAAVSVTTDTDVVSYLEYIEKYYQKYCFKSCRNVKFALATFGNDAGIFGAAKLVLG